MTSTRLSSAEHPAIARDLSVEERPLPEGTGMIGASPAYRDLVKRIQRMSCAGAPVLIEGETGVGKELAARAIHYLSDRQEQPFIPINCGAIPDSLVESELFGHVRGAFTDARHARHGVITQAHGGTLFLDEVDALSLKAQVALLRFLEDHRYRPVGDDRDYQCDVRVMAASNCSLHRRASEGTFRSDLLYRLDILTLRVPSLRERGADVLVLAQHFLTHHCREYRLPCKRLHATTERWLLDYEWPGNVRELQNLMHRLVLMAESDEISYRGAETLPRSDIQRPASEFPSFQSAKASAVAAFERCYLTELLNRAVGNVSAAARLAGKERRALGKLLRKHGLDTANFRGDQRPRSVPQRDD
jgi:two-component system, NtrC family, response regulator GlrR